MTFFKKITKELWALILTIISGLIATLLLLRDDPAFDIINKKVRPDSQLIIVATNGRADKKRFLDIEIDGFKHTRLGEPIDTGEVQTWVADLNQNQMDTLKAGYHTIKIGFSGKKYTSETQIVILSGPPIVHGELSDSTDGKILKVRATDQLRLQEDTISLQLFFYIDGEPNSIDVPVSEVVDENGLFYFRFEIPLTGLPNYSSNDPQFTQDFFEILLKDQAGNVYYDKQSYAQFIAPGNRNFGITDINIEFAKINHPFNFLEKNLLFTLIPNPTKIHSLQNGEPPIKLTVTTTVTNARLVTYENNPTIKTQQITIIFRDEKILTTSLTDRFIDKEILNKDEINYRVERKSKDNNFIYSSNKVSISIKDDKKVDCRNNSDCDDSQPCTTDSCMNNQCRNIEVICDDYDLCTNDFCQPTSGTCMHWPVDCNDQDDNTVDYCLEGFCHNDKKASAAFIKEHSKFTIAKVQLEGRVSTREKECIKLVNLRKTPLTVNILAKVDPTVKSATIYISCSPPKGGISVNKYSHTFSNGAKVSYIASINITSSEKEVWYPVMIPLENKLTTGIYTFKVYDGNEKYPIQLYSLPVPFCD